MQGSSTFFTLSFSKSNKKQGEEKFGWKYPASAVLGISVLFKYFLGFRTLVRLDVSVGLFPLLVEKIRRSPECIINHFNMEV